MPIVTKQLLEEGLSFRGAYNTAQLRSILPIHEFTGAGTWSLRKGWKSRLLGTKVMQEQVDEFLRLKNKHLSRKALFQVQNNKQLKSF